MKIFDRLDETLSHKPKIKVLRFLAIGKGEYTGRGIARAVGMSASSIHQILQEMKDENLVVVRKIGNAILYKIYAENYIIKNLIMPLFEKEKRIYDDLVLLIKKQLKEGKDEISCVAVFGSVAQRKETAKSDLDLVVITKTKKGKTKIDKLMDNLSISLANKFQVLLSPYILGYDEIKKMNTKKSALVRNILKNNRLIDGEPIERILA
ncbi:hypothetical protein MNBD_BACTEROID05-34 [hydrothermal vent metagenome]|uniref:HTH arsR-type domain-containing protein n=1 Tax=hydrothermal vent metagenome TaxID=652676 RepID=A0A3B0TQD5_9ZZZZ